MPESESQTFDEFVEEVHEAAKQYCEEHDVEYWKAKRLDLDAANQRVGLALAHLRDVGKVKQVSRIRQGGASTWRFTDHGRAGPSTPKWCKRCPKGHASLKLRKTKDHYECVSCRAYYSGHPLDARVADDFPLDPSEYEEVGSYGSGTATLTEGNA